MRNNYSNHPEKKKAASLAYSRACYRVTPGKKRASSRQHYSANTEKKRAYSRQQYSANPSKNRLPHVHTWLSTVTRTRTWNTWSRIYNTSLQPGRPWPYEETFIALALRT